MLTTTFKKLLVLVALTSFISFHVNGQNQALDLSATGNEVDVSYTLNTSGFTVEQWIYIPTSITQITSLVNQTNSNTARPLDAYVTSTGQVSFWIGDDVSSQEGLTSAGAITANTWHHIAIVYDPTSTGTEGQIYIDGVSTAVTTSSYTVGTATNDGIIRIGNRADGTIEGDPIYFDEIRIWDTPRSGAQISADYNTTIDPTSTGLDVYLKFESNLLIDYAANSGDQSGTVGAGSVAFTDGPVLQNNALNFDGTDDVVDLGSITQFNIGTAFSFEAWVNIDAYPSSFDAVLFNKWQSGVEDKLVAITPSGNLSFLLVGSTVSLTSASTIPTGEWVHVAATYDGVNARLYLNGEEDNSMAASGDVTDGSGTMYLGGNGDGRSTSEFEYFAGSLDEVRFWNDALTFEEINDNAYAKVSPEASLTAYYDFDLYVASGDNTGATTLFDAGGLGLDGTLSGFALNFATSNWVTSTAWDADVFIPYFPTGYPAISNIGLTSFDLTIQLNELGQVYYVVLPNGHPNPPTRDDVLAGTDGLGSPGVASGNFPAAIAFSDILQNVTGLSQGTAYDLYVVAEDDEGVPNIQSQAVILNFTTATLPASPSNLVTLEISNSQIDLSWTDNSLNETDFAIFRSAGNNASFSEIGTVGGADITTFTDNTVSTDGNYFYYVVARNGGGDSAPSNEKAAATFTAPGNTLFFDNDVNNHVTLSQNPLGGGYTGNFTLEAWVHPTNLLLHENTYGGGIVRNANNEAIGDFFLSVLSDGRVAFAYWDAAGSDPDGLMYSTTIIPEGAWTHLAATYDGSSAKIFINGQEELSTTSASTASGWGTGFELARSYTSSTYHWNGELDEIRIWNVARNQSEIQSTLETALVGNEAGLTAYYKFDQTDPSITTLPDRSVNQNDGSLINFAGAATWNSSGALSLPPPNAPSDLFTIEVSGSQIDLSWTDNSLDETDFAIFRSDGNNASFSEIGTVGGADITTYSDNTVSADGNYFYYVVARNSNGDSAPSNEKAAATFTPPGNSLTFDGVDDRIDMPHDPTIDFGSGDFSISLWFNSVNPSVDNQALAIKGGYSPSSPGYHLTLFSSTVRFSFTDGTTNDLVDAPVSASQWYHVVGVRSGSLFSIYLNGQLVESKTVAVGSLGNSNLLQMGDVGGFNLYSGQLDEVSMWSKALSAAEIGNLLNTPLVGNEGNLEAYYEFDQTDATITVLPDRSTNQNDGILQNFGGAASWGASGALALSAVNEMQVTGLGVEIVSGDATPDTADDTDFGDGGVSHPVTKTYTINNLGTADLNLGTDAVSASGDSAFEVGLQPDAVVPAGGSTTFTIVFTAPAENTFNSQIIISNDDSDENPYTFNVTGNGIPDAPSQQVTNISVTNIGENSADISWTFGNGWGSVIAIYEGNDPFPTPSDNVTYNPDPIYAAGDDIGGGWYVVYVGTGTSVTVTGLNPGQEYTVAGLEFYGDPGTELYNAATDTDNPVSFTTNTVAGNNALNFDQIDDYVDLGNPPALDLADDLTLEAWVYWNGDNTAPHTIVSRAKSGETSADNVMYLFQINGDGRVRLFYEYDAGLDVDAYSTSAIPSNSWVHVAVTRETGPDTGADTRTRFYINGQPDGEITGQEDPWDGGSGTQLVWIGAANQSGSERYFGGSIDELRIWNIERTQGDIEANMNVSLTGLESGLAAYYDFNQGTPEGINTSETTLLDLGSNSIIGTLNGFALTGTSSNWIASGAQSGGSTSSIFEDFESGTVPSADYSGTLSLGSGDWESNSLSPEMTNVQSGAEAISFNQPGDYLQSFQIAEGVVDISFFVNQDVGDGGELDVLYSTDGGSSFNSAGQTGLFTFTTYEELIIPIGTTEPTILRIEAITTNEPIYLDDITININSGGGPAPGLPRSIYFTTAAGTDIFKVDILGGTEESLVASNAGSDYGIAYSSANDQVVYIDGSSGIGDRIMVAGSDGSGPTVLVDLGTSGSTYGSLALDTVTQVVYAITPTGLQAWDLNSGTFITNYGDIFIGASGAVRDIEIYEGFLYWSQSGTDNGIASADLTDIAGTSQLIVDPAVSGDIPGLTIDPVDNRLYWTTDAGEIRYSNFDGSNEQILVDGLTGLRDIEMNYENRHLIYVTEFLNATIESIDTEATPQSTLLTFTGSINYIHPYSTYSIASGGSNFFEDFDSGLTATTDPSVLLLTGTWQTQGVKSAEDPSLTSGGSGDAAYMFFGTGNYLVSPTIQNASYVSFEYRADPVSAGTFDFDVYASSDGGTTFDIFLGSGSTDGTEYIQFNHNFGSQYTGPIQIIYTGGGSESGLIDNFNSDGFEVPVNVTYTTLSALGGGLTAGSTNNLIYGFSIAPANDIRTIGVILTLDDSNYLAGDFPANPVTLWSNTTDDFSSATVIGSYDFGGTVPPDGISVASNQVAMLFSDVLTGGSTTYYYVTIDIDAGALVGNSLSVFPINLEQEIGIDQKTNTLGSLGGGNLFTIGSGGSFPGTALQFDGLDDQVVLSNPVQQNWSDFTIEMWVKIPSGSSSQYNFFEQVDDLGSGTPQIIIAGTFGGTPYIFIRQTDNGTTGTLTGGTNIADDQWHHVAYVKSGTQLTSYVDGIQDNTATTTVSNINFPGSNVSAKLAGNSALDEVKFWNIVKTDFSDRTTALTGGETNLIGYYPFDEGTGTIAGDLSGFTNTGTLTNFNFIAGSDWITSGPFPTDITAPVVTVDLLETNVTSPELTGSVDDNAASIAVTVNGTGPFSATNNADGTWTLTAGTITPPLVDGVYDVSVTAEDSFGNVGTDGTLNELTIDATAPIVTVDETATSLRSPELTGQVDDVNATLSLTVNGGNYVPVNNGDGTWTLAAASITPNLADGSYDVAITATDAVGNIGSDATVDELIISQSIVALSATNITSTGFTARWSVGLDVQTYQVDVSTVADFSTFVNGFQSFETTANSVVVSNLDFATSYYYRVRLVNTNSTVSANSNTRSVKTTRDAVTEADSLALRQIYVAIAPQGLNWETARLRNWDGVTLDISRTRVEVVDISATSAAGNMPNPFTGNAFTNGGLSAMQEMNASQNQITGLMDYSGTAITSLNVSGNSLEFDDLIPVAGIASVDYSNQASIQFNEASANPIEVRYLNDYLLTFDIGGANNDYNWFRNDVLIASGQSFQDNGQTGIIQAIDYDNMGIYRAEVTNSAVPGLTIDVDPQTVWAIADMQVSVTDADGAALAAPLNAYMLETTRTPTGYRVLETLENVNTSTFTFPDVVLGNYIILIESDIELYIPTYYGDVFEWREAETLFFRSDDVIAMQMTTVPRELTAADGEGTLAVLIEEDFGDNGGRVDARRRAAQRKCGLRRKRSGGRTGQDDDEFELIAYGETDDNGEFQFGFLPQGLYRFFVEYPGIPIDESSFVEFEVGEAGVSDTDFKLQAFASEDGIEITIEAVLGIILEYFKDLEIYPNPSSEYLNIRYRHLKSGEVTAQLVDLAGNTKWSSDLRNGFDGQLRIDVKDFEEGIYILRFYDRENPKDNVMSFRIIVKD